MDVLLENFTLREINFGNSPIWYSVKKQLQKNVQYRESCLRKLPVAKAWASRVFLCGSPYAGMCHGSDTTVCVLCLLHGISRAGGFRFFLSKNILFQPAKSSILKVDCTPGYTSRSDSLVHNDQIFRVDQYFSHWKLAYVIGMRVSAS